MNSQSTRPPAVAGMFYPEGPSDLKYTIERAFVNREFGPGAIPPAPTKRKIYGIVTPHAGYSYSGAIAANGYYQISGTNFKTAILVGPNHFGIGSGIAATNHETWKTPLGLVEVNSSLSGKIVQRSSIIDFDEFAHSRDHCLEVQIPFLQFIRSPATFDIVPIIMRLQDNESARVLGKAIAEAVIDESTLAEQTSNNPRSDTQSKPLTEFSTDDQGVLARQSSNNNTAMPILIASSDLTHYEENDEAHRKDNEIIKTILSLNLPKFYDTLNKYDISACGYGAIASVMVAAAELGATRGELLRYGTSGDVTGDRGSVVGYSSIVFV